VRAKDAVEGAGKALCVGGADVEGVEAFIVVGDENGPLRVVSLLTRASVRVRSLVLSTLPPLWPPVPPALYARPPATTIHATPRWRHS